MTKRDYYEILGADRGADEAELKRVYRRLAMEHHPDRNPNDPKAAERMKELNEAYAVLSDPQKRRVYDAYGHAGLDGYSQEDLFRGVDFSSLFSDLGLRDLFGGGLFGSLFGGVGARQGPRRGADLRYDLEVTLEEVASGVAKTIEVTIDEECPVCQGAGAEAHGLNTCARCRGSGQIVQDQRAGGMLFRQVAGCPVCRGRGQTITEDCKQCGGMGSQERTRELSVEIPPGADTGNAVRLPGEGASGPGGPGDLLVVLHVRPHEVFRKEEDNLIVVKEIDFATAALGGNLPVPGLNETHTLTIPEGAQGGSTYRIPGAGLPHLYSSSRGDVYVVVRVVTPTGLSEEERDLFARLAKLRPQEANGNHPTDA